MTDINHPVICGNCGAPNRADAELCARCGATLAAYQPVAGTLVALDSPTPGATPANGASTPAAEASPSTVPPAPAVGPLPSTEPEVPPVARDTRPTSHFRHVTYTAGPRAQEPPAAQAERADTGPAHVAPDGAAPATAAASTSSVIFPVPPAAPAAPPSPPPPTTAAPGVPAPRDGSPAPAPQVAPRPPKSSQRRAETTARREAPRPAPAWPPVPSRPDRLARTSGATLITWGIGLVLLAFIIGIALPNATHQTLGEAIVTLATVVGIVLFVVGLAHRTGARRPADRRPRRRR